MKIESIKVSGKECLSGSFIASTSDTNEITFSRDLEKITIKFSFEVKEDKKITTSSEGEGNNLTVILKLPLLADKSQGITHPMLFAKFDNLDEIYLQLWITKIAEPYVEINYSIYIKKVND